MSPIAELNDQLRRTFSPKYGKIMMTAGVAALCPKVRSEVFHKVQTFDAFTEENNPYDEHDFVNVEVEGIKFFAKFDYYDLKVQYGSPDPADPTKTVRVLTIMKAEEY
jgi:hypothetical protein